MRFRKFIALFLSTIMLMSFSTMFVSVAEERSINYPKSWLDVGETLTLTLTLPSGASSVTWASSNTSVATVTQDGVVTGISRGENIKITATYTVSGVETVDEFYISIYNDSRGIVNGQEYYIMNTATKKNLSLSSASTANNTGIGLTTRSNSVMQQWKLTRQSDGKYTVVSMYNSTTKGMYANTSTNDVYLYTVGSSAARFEIERVNAGNSNTGDSAIDNGYRGTYLIRFGSKYLSASTTTDVYLSDTLSANCYWSFSRAEKQIAELDSFYYPDEDRNNDVFDTTANNEKFNTNMNSYGYNANVYVNRYVENTYEDLPDCSVFVFRGHAGPGKLCYYDSISETLVGLIRATTGVGSSGYTSVYTISDFDVNELANIQCTVLLGCNTGKYIKAYNTVNEFFNKGAHFALGTTRTMYTPDNNAWLSYFLDAINGGDNIGDAIDYANEQIGPVECTYTKADGTKAVETVNIFPLYYVGDTYQFLN